MNHRGALTTVAVLVVATVAGPVSSATMSVRDRDDVDVPLDLARVRIVQADDGGLVVRLRTHDRFANREVRGGVGWFRIGVDLDGDRGWERNLFLQHDDGRMRGLLVGEDLATVIGEVETSRPSRRAVRSRVPAADLVGASSMRIRAWSVYRASPCSEREPCTDFVPDRGWITLDPVTVSLRASVARSRPPASARARTTGRSTDSGTTGRSG
jgi:hypothetical protein